MSKKQTIFDFGTTAYLGKSSSFVSFEKDTGFLDDTKNTYATVEPKNIKKEIEFVYWGKSNKLPVEILDKVHGNITVASNTDFNARISYGDGLIVAKKVKKDSLISYEELLPSENPEIFEFLENNNVTRILQEAGNDLVTFADGYIELIFNRKEKAQIVKVRHKEVAFSRLSKQHEKTGIIEYHGYSSKWGESQQDDIIATPFLDRAAPLYDLKKRLGILPDENTGKVSKTSEKRFILSLGLPVPGRFYYNKPYWWSIFKSGWYDISCAMPLFKQALIENKMKILFEVKINETFWEKLFKSEGITDPKKKADRKTQFLKELDDFLAGKENAGKSFVSHFKYDQIKGYEIHDIIIKPIQSNQDGGEYNEDVEEANNVISYAMGVHPSLQGATPGKSKNINGTEARELFIIKQAMTKPLRDALLQFLYVCKAINGWDQDIHFVIPNIMLTTLDKNTGAEKSIGNQKM
ncbi:hypothetical protein JGH11_04555 [Dysgonomonas sp. Marseille-P4677]|uniref:hypothetical protein n=1 Tax=Dysgonomonas sp. Marseille-P4677 TaxID=2364790 RepID=UPI001914C509|nr:hypothetical protein [Dysgonomonas sp. Marseille-P4677]MBK5720138.1 hypothetical protein [Dysgonomonas sp. Marseille-P4677]